MITNVEGVAVDPMGQVCPHLKFRVTCVESFQNEVVPGITGIVSADAEGAYAFTLAPGVYLVETLQQNTFEWIDNGKVDIGEGIEYTLSVPELLKDYKWAETVVPDEGNPVLPQ